MFGVNVRCTETRLKMERLFVYGSLAPGRPNAHVLAEVPGSWEPASVKGRLRAEGGAWRWGFQDSIWTSGVR